MSAVKIDDDLCEISNIDEIIHRKAKIHIFS
jgi:hypothetical protein